MAFRVRLFRWGGCLDSFLQWLASSPPATWIQALGTPIIGLVAAYVAYQSATTARKKLKFDMFEKRLRVYEEVRAFLKLAGTGTLTVDDTQALTGSIAHAKFLYADGDIDAFLGELAKRSRQLLRMFPPKRPSALSSTSNLYTMPDPDPLLMARRRLMDQYRMSKVKDGVEPPSEDVPGRDWLGAAKWIEDHKDRWNTLTLKYLQLNH